MSDTDGETPLHLAVTARSIVALSALLAAGARVDAENFAEETPLALALGDAEPEPSAALAETLRRALADEAGPTLVQMAVAFATRHRAVTSAIIGPRTTEHLEGYLAADGIALSGEVLDRIDKIVPPGITINVADNMREFGRTALAAASRRR